MLAVFATDIIEESIFKTKFFTNEKHIGEGNILVKGTELFFLNVINKTIIIIIYNFNAFDSQETYLMCFYPH